MAKKTKKVICFHCGHKGNPRKHTRGSLIVEMIMWCALVIPGMIYSTWRMSTKQKVCRKCGCNHVVSMNTPHGRELVKMYS